MPPIHSGMVSAIPHSNMVICSCLPVTSVPETLWRRLFALRIPVSEQERKLHSRMLLGESFDIARPGLELKGFRRVSLEPGQSADVVFQLRAEDLFFHDESLKRVFPDGKYSGRYGWDGLLPI